MAPSRCGTGIIASVIAEFVGSFYFAFCTCVSTTMWPQSSESSVLSVAVLFGLCLTVITQCTSKISAGYVNPVVAVALYITQRLGRLQFFLYIPAQILGGITGAAFHHVVTPRQENDNKRKTGFADDVELTQGFVIQFALAILFIFAFFVVLFGNAQEECCKPGDAEPWKIGLIYTLCLIVDIPYTGSGLNPAWSFGVAVVKNKWGKFDRINYWIYWVAPILGGALGGTLFEIWTSASELNDVQRYSQFKRMVALLVILVMVITFALVMTLAL